jgi:hypothetical protein
MESKLQGSHIFGHIRYRQIWWGRKHQSQGGQNQGGNWGISFHKWGGWLGNSEDKMVGQEVWVVKV